MHHFLEVWFRWVQTGGYPVIILLMAMESSIIPIPSEIIIPPAAFLAARGDLNVCSKKEKFPKTKLSSLWAAMWAAVASKPGFKYPPSTP